MGGLVACNVAAREDRVKKLILIGPVHPTPETRNIFENRIRTLKEGICMIVEMADRYEGGMDAIAETIPRSATGSRTTPLARSFIRQLIQSQDAQGYGSLCKVLAGSSPPNYAAIGVPTLIIAGEGDKAAPLDGCDAIKANISADVELKILDGVGHWHCIEAPEQVAAAIDRFL